MNAWLNGLFSVESFGKCAPQQDRRRHKVGHELSD